MPLDQVYPDFPDNEGCVLQVTIYVSPEQVPKFFGAYKVVYDACISEEECTLFAVYEDPEEPGKLSWVEHWLVVFDINLPLLHHLTEIMYLGC